MAEPLKDSTISIECPEAPEGRFFDFCRAFMFLGLSLQGFLVPFYVYILRMGDGRLYVGQTSDLQRRFEDHENGFASATTRFFGKEKCIYVEKHPDRVSAVVREKQIKKWGRAKKLALAKGDFHKLKELSRRRIPLD